MYVNAEMIPVEIIPGMGWGQLRRMVQGVNYTYNVFDTL
jgi:hypothetical protein